jgi:hypothetical protein
MRSQYDRRCEQFTPFAQRRRVIVGGAQTRKKMETERFKLGA